ncbi:MAG: hypothetical protein JXA23_09710, partial [Bacteroidales bacterium]|nr:hypothetical protein [Bacteroidales bacterium]
MAKKTSTPIATSEPSKLKNKERSSAKKPSAVPDGKKPKVKEELPVTEGIKGEMVSGRHETDEKVDVSIEQKLVA